MLHFSKTVHVLALGLWFGAVVFFVVAASVQLRTLDETSKLARAQRLSVDTRRLCDYKPDAPRENVPDSLQKALPEEQGSRAFGAIVGPVFSWYYGIQAGCGVLTVLTALGWWMSRRGSRMHAVRSVLLALALGGVGLGWWMEGVVDRLRGPRDDATAAVLKEDPTAEEVDRAVAARGEFVRWHGYSLLANFGVILLVGVAMALAAQMPAPSPPPATDEEKKIG